jgi:S-adenosylhomocysteine hydrolase
MAAGRISGCGCRCEGSGNQMAVTEISPIKYGKVLAEGHSVLTMEREPGKAHIRKLAGFFHFSPAAFF